MATDTACPSATRVALILHGLLLLGTGLQYLVGCKENSWQTLDSLFEPTLVEACSGESQCWMALIPFYAVLFIALGLLSILAALTSPFVHSTCVLLVCAFVHAAQAALRQALPSILYREGAASRASAFQGVLAMATLALAFWSIFARKANEKKD